jgi:hypothetical protein
VKTNKTDDGQMVEWLNTPVLKTGRLARVSWVRIPLCPPIFPQMLKTTEHKMKNIIFAMTLMFSFIVNSAFAADAVDPLSSHKKIVEFAKSKMNKSVGGRDSIDLCYEALKYANAKSDYPKESTFGDVIDYKKTKIVPGDMIFFGKKTKFENDKTKEGYVFDEHAGIILSSNGNVIEMAHQDFANNRFVMTTKVDLSTLKTGDVTVYRPVPLPSEKEGEKK